MATTSGSVPWFAKTPKLTYSTCNARSEELADKATFKDPWKHGKRSSMHLRPLDSSPILLVAVEGPSCEIRDVAVSKDTVSVMVTSDLVKSAADAAAFLVGPLGLSVLAVGVIERCTVGSDVGLLDGCVEGCPVGCTLGALDG